ncbi:MAG: UDP-glucose 4-epimerase GalE [Candidatus Eiseniibacteriota bacterium]|nr:MAG: UDP-glucose 4-epimerase GalE [Candidatus Eisenbacteria bacterium]
MNILVTGGAGYIGSVLVELLVIKGHSVVVFDNLSTGHRGAVEPSAKLVTGDLCDAAEVERLFTENMFNCVMHLACHTLVEESMRFPEKYYWSGLVCGLNLLSAMVRHGTKRMVFSSSAAVYGEPESVPISETAATLPQNPYGECKLAFERMLHWFNVAHGLDYVSLRYFNAAGATAAHGESHEPETHLIPVVLKTALGQRDVIEVFGTDYPTPDGTCVRDYVHVVDLAEAHVLAADALLKGSTGIFNLGNGSGFSVNEVISAAREVTGADIRTKNVARRKGDPARLVASSDKAVKELGWNPKRTSLQEIILSAWRWMKDHPVGYAD